MYAITYPCHINVEEDIKYEYMFMLPLKNLARKGWMTEIEKIVCKCI